MCGASSAAITARSSRSAKSAILARSSSRQRARRAAHDDVGRDTDAAQLVDRVLRRLGLQLARGLDHRHERDVHVAARCRGRAALRSWRIASRNGRLSMSPTVPPISVSTTSTSSRSTTRRMRALDLVGDVRDHLHGLAEVVALALRADDGVVDRAGRGVRGARRVLVDEALVVAEIEVGLGAVVGDEHLAVLVRATSCPGSTLMYGSSFCTPTLRPRALSSVPERGGGDALAERGDDAARDEDVLRTSRPPRHSPSRHPSRFGMVAGAAAGTSPGEERASFTPLRRLTASARASGSPTSAPSIRTSSSTTPSPVSSSIRVSLGSPAVLTTRKWRVGERRDLRQVRDAEELACRSASARSCSPTARAVRPPMPASTSSNTSVGARRGRAPRARTASTTRESSPPDAVVASGAAASAGVRLQEQLDVVGAARPRLAVRDADLELRVLHPEVGEVRLDRSRERLRRRGSELAKRRHGGARARRRRSPTRVRSLASSSSAAPTDSRAARASSARAASSSAPTAP